MNEHNTEQKSKEQEITITMISQNTCYVMLVFIDMMYQNSFDEFVDVDGAIQIYTDFGHKKYKFVLGI